MGERAQSTPNVESFNLKYKYLKEEEKTQMVQFNFNWIASWNEKLFWEHFSRLLSLDHHLWQTIRLQRTLSSLTWREKHYPPRTQRAKDKSHTSWFTLIYLVKLRNCPFLCLPCLFLNQQATNNCEDIRMLHICGPDISIVWSGMESLGNWFFAFNLNPNYPWPQTSKSPIAYNVVIGTADHNCTLVMHLKKVTRMWL